MATDHHVDSHCLDRQRGVDECLAFGQAAGAGRKVDRIRAKSASGEAETSASSGGVFEEQIGNDDAFQHVQSLSSAEGGSIIVFREIQNGGQLFGRQSLQPQQVPLTPRPAYRKIIEYHQTPFRSRLTFSCLSGESICICDPIQLTVNPLCGFPQQGQCFRSRDLLTPLALRDERGAECIYPRRLTALLAAAQRAPDDEGFGAGDDGLRKRCRSLCK